MKRKTSSLIILCLLSVFLIWGGTFVYKVLKYSSGPGADSQVFEIKEGMTGRGVARELKAGGFIKSEILFLGFLKMTVGGHGLKAGRFDLGKHMGSLAVINCISSGKCQHLEKITVLEGWRIEETAEALSAAGITSSQEFTRLAKERELEGYLYPSTYHFPANTPAQKVIGVMTAEFEKRVRPVLNSASVLGLSEKQILTIASIVEREAVLHEERPKIAAVYLNRVKISKKLEADPTVQYAIGYTPAEGRYWKKNLTLWDLRNVKSPYNTYLYAGIPPGPICSPSLASVYAVINPDPQCDSIFFVADNKTGGHLFSRTYSEHVRNIRNVRGR